MTFRQIQRAVAGILRESGISAPENDALFLLQYVTGMDLTRYLMKADEEAAEMVRERCEKLARVRASHVPLQHITGSAPFFGREFAVNGNVLIPRPETEILAEEALRILESEFPGGRVLDLCTGSGILAVTLCLEAPQAAVEASDLSPAALDVARGNARRLGAQVSFYQGDLFENAEGPFDMIVTNPPYIPSSVIPTLESEVKDHDPLLALDGGEDGFSVIGRIVCDAPAYLKENGWLLVETGYDQGERISRELEAAKWRDIRILKDLSGHSRVARARRPAAQDDWREE